MACSPCCSRYCRKEWSPRNFWFNINQPQLIISSQWSRFPCWLYVVWRCVAAIYHLVWIILSGTELLTRYPEGQGEKWFIFLTNWQYFVVTLSLIVQAVVALVCCLKKDLVPNDHMTWYLRFSWLMDTLANTILILVGIMFWGLIYGPSIYLTDVDINTHGITLLYFAINICISGTPVRTYHFVYSIGFGLTYLIFTVIYYHAGGLHPVGGTFIYKGVLDWRYPSTTLMYALILIFIGIPLVHFVVYGLYLIRITIYHRGCQYWSLQEDDNQIAKNTATVESDVEMKHTESSDL